ncbi:MAG: hypothetical protein ABIJ59_08735 [Pseudomonadota bacterium]
MRKTNILIILGVILFFFGGCATPGKQFIDIRYMADHEQTQTGMIGLAVFTDKRPQNGEGYVGYRTLMDNSRETYFVTGVSLSYSLTRVTGVYLEKNGFVIAPVEPWEKNVEEMKKASKGFKQVLSAEIIRFECRAKKKGVTTKMTLDIGLIFYLGMADDNSLKRIPVSLKLERTEFGFSPEKLEKFVNQSMEEVIQKALVF